MIVIRVSLRELVTIFHIEILCIEFPFSPTLILVLHFVQQVVGHMVVRVVLEIRLVCIAVFQVYLIGLQNRQQML